MNLIMVASISLLRPVMGSMSPSSHLYIPFLIFAVLVSALIAALKIWRGIDWLRYKRRQSLSLSSKPAFDGTTPIKVPGTCPRCGAITSVDAVMCQTCGLSLLASNALSGQQRAMQVEQPGQVQQASQVQSQDDPMQSPGIIGSKCPYCGLMLASGTTTCPRCDWRLKEDGLNNPSSRRRIGIVRDDLVLDGILAFKKDEWVEIEGESPDPGRPEYKYIVLSKTLNKKFLLSDKELTK